MTKKRSIEEKISKIQEIIGEKITVQIEIPSPNKFDIVGIRVDSEDNSSFERLTSELSYIG